jgi:hypothetical protein
MMEIHRKVALGLYVQIKSAVNAKKGQHVIEKCDSGFDVGLTLSIQVQFNLNLGFRCFSFESARPGHGSSPYHMRSVSCRRSTPEAVILDLRGLGIRVPQRPCTPPAPSLQPINRALGQSGTLQPEAAVWALPQAVSGRGDAIGFENAAAVI